MESSINIMTSSADPRSNWAKPSFRSLKLQPAKPSESCAQLQVASLRTRAGHGSSLSHVPLD